MTASLVFSIQVRHTWIFSSLYAEDTDGKAIHQTACHHRQTVQGQDSRDRLLHYLKQEVSKRSVCVKNESLSFNSLSNITWDLIFHHDLTRFVWQSKVWSLCRHKIFVIQRLMWKCNFMKMFENKHLYKFCVQILWKTLRKKCFNIITLMFYTVL